MRLKIQCRKLLKEYLEIRKKLDFSYRDIFHRKIRLKSVNVVEQDLQRYELRMFHIVANHQEIKKNMEEQ